MKTELKICNYILVIGLLSLSSVAYGANECKLKYSWNSGNSLEGTFKNDSKTIYLDEGEIKSISKKRMNYVKNRKTRKVKFYLDGASDITLEKNQRNPVIGNYLTTVKLVKVKCSSSSSGTSTMPGSQSGGGQLGAGMFPGSPNKSGFPCITKAPAPPAPFVPAPYPCASKISQGKTPTKVKMK